MRDKSFRVFLLVLSAVTAMLLPTVFPPLSQEVFEDCAPADASPAQVRSVSAITYQLPADLHYQKQTFPREKLLNGRMMLIDQTHPLPEDLLPPNTVSIAQYGAGMVPVRSLQIRSGYATIDALRTLFSQLRAKGVNGLAVSQGTMSTAQQRQALLRYARALMKDHPPEEAVRLAADAMERPGTGSLLQEYAVEISGMDGMPLDDTMDGQTLLQLCWRYGFVRESDQIPWRFRYVGKAHATAMTYLDLDLERYLEWLHQKGRIAVSAGGRLQYLILCEPLQNGYATFELPSDASVEVSMDNTGYALAACTF